MKPLHKLHDDLTGAPLFFDADTMDCVYDVVGVVGPLWEYLKEQFFHLPSYIFSLLLLEPRESEVPAALLSFSFKDLFL